jgi:hypothetical protein
MLLLLHSCRTLFSSYSLTARHCEVRSNLYAIQSGLAKCAYHVKPLIAAEATTFVLIQKVAKNQVSRNASLPHRAIALQIRQNLGCCLFTPLRSLIVQASVKSRYALPLRTRPPLFCLISSEAVLLTKEERNKFFLPHTLSLYASLRGTKQSPTVQSRSLQISFINSNKKSYDSYSLATQVLIAPQFKKALI